MGMTFSAAGAMMTGTLWGLIATFRSSRPDGLRDQFYGFREL